MTDIKQLKHISEYNVDLCDKDIILFLDYDGTLVDIVSDPDNALLSDNVKNLLQQLSKKYITTIVTGRDLTDIKRKVDIDNIGYIACHGFQIESTLLHKDFSKEYVEIINEAGKLLKHDLENIEECIIEYKRCILTIHYRNVKQNDLIKIINIISIIENKFSNLTTKHGKFVYEIRPKCKINKGTSVQWFLDKLNLNNKFPIFLGDDLTDETVFKMLNGLFTKDELSIIVADTDTVNDRVTDASWRIKNPDEVHEFLQKLYILEN